MKSSLNHYISKGTASHFIVALLRAVLIIGMCYVFLFPILYMVSVSIRDPMSVNDPSVVWIPKAFSLTSIKEVLEIMHYKEAVTISGIMTVFCTIGSLISCSLVGYGLSRFKFFEKKILFAIVILMIIIPPQTILVSSFLNFRYFDFGGLLKLLAPITGVNHINLTEAPFSVLTFILPSMFAAGLRAGLFIFIFRQFFSGMPNDLEEAAKIDGCNAFKTYVRIIVPLAKPAFITVLLYSAIWHWNDFYMSSMYFMGDIKPVSVMLSNLVNLLKANTAAFITLPQDTLRTYLAAGSLLTVIPPLILYLLTQKYFTENIQRTGIVG